jgi:hypothetical protein
LAFAQAFALLDTSRHDVKGFSCGKPPMDEFLKRHAARHMKIGVSSTWVLPVLEQPQPTKARLAAYYSLTTASVKKEEIPTDQSLPKYPLPVVLLARLAVDQEFSRQGLGGKTLVTALRKAVEVTERGLPAVGLILDVLDEDALAFYRHYEMFEPFTDDPMRLFVSMHTLRGV